MTGAKRERGEERYKGEKREREEERCKGEKREREEERCKGEKREREEERYKGDKRERKEVFFKKRDNKLPKRNSYRAKKINGESIVGHSQKVIYRKILILSSTFL